MNASTDAAGAAPAPRSKGKLVLYIVIGIAVLAGLLLAGHQASGVVIRFAGWVKGLGVWGPIVFILGYALATVAFLPGSILTLASGIIFGLVQGTIYSLVGATLGASGAFLIARYVARSRIERKIEGNAKFAAIDKAVGGEGFKIVSLLRLSPAFPFNLLNYALGLTKVRFLPYLAACAAMLPGTLLYVYYGTVLGNLADLASGTKTQKGAEFWIFLGVGLLATIGVTIYVTRLARKALNQQIDTPAENKKTEAKKTEANK